MHSAARTEPVPTPLDLVGSYARTGYRQSSLASLTDMARSERFYILLSPVWVLVGLSDSNRT